MLSCRRLYRSYRVAPPVQAGLLSRRAAGAHQRTRSTRRLSAASASAATATASVAAGAAGNVGRLAAEAAGLAAVSATVTSALAATARAGTLARPVQTAAAVDGEQRRNDTGAQTSVAAPGGGAAATGTKSTTAAPEPPWHHGHFSIWRGDGGQPTSLEALLDVALEADVLVLGEEHDDRVAHALQ
jgi:hypothetical protein